MNPTDQEINETICHFIGYRYEDVKYTFNFLDPERGLGLLFKYAVPKIPNLGRIIFSSPSNITITKGWILDVESNKLAYLSNDYSPTRALAMAIYKLIKETE